MASSVSGKIAFVTGGASGIGAALTTKLVDGGAEVWIADRQIGAERRAGVQHAARPRHRVRTRLRGRRRTRAQGRARRMAPLRRHVAVAVGFGETHFACCKQLVQPVRTAVTLQVRGMRGTAIGIGDCVVDVAFGRRPVATGPAPQTGRSTGTSRCSWVTCLGVSSSRQVTPSSRMARVNWPDRISTAR
jgi:NAD(P)-dependent dehydrogenase (short-subunit alcohol dehydrogenase family)